MTNKVKPFYIRITDDMTPQMVQDAFDKCVDVGAAPFDCVIDCDARYRYQSEYELNFVCFGVDFDGETYLSDEHERYGRDAQEITLEQLDEWLGIKNEAEWDGEYCLQGQKDWYKYKSTYVASNGDMFAMCLVPHANNGKPFEQYLNIDETEFRTIETPEQKAERERLEGIKEMAQTPKPCGFAIYDICEQLYDAGYRKQ